MTCNVDTTIDEDNNVAVTDDVSATLEDTNNVTPEVTDNTDDYTDDLKSLSNLKKYKINLMCIENLKEIGWTKLGDNLEEDRRWKRTTELREREHIKAAVTYYIDNNKKKKLHRRIMVSKVRKNMNWEIKLKMTLHNVM